jgi:hypothetical protein
LDINKKNKKKKKTRWMDSIKDTIAQQKKNEFENAQNDFVYLIATGL